MGEAAGGGGGRGCNGAGRPWWILNYSNDFLDLQVFIQLHAGQQRVTLTSRFANSSVGGVRWLSILYYLNDIYEAYITWQYKNYYRQASSVWKDFVTYHILCVCFAIFQQMSDVVKLLLIGVHKHLVWVSASQEPHVKVTMRECTRRQGQSRAVDVVEKFWVKSLLVAFFATYMICSCRLWPYCGCVSNHLW